MRFARPKRLCRILAWLPLLALVCHVPATAGSGTASFWGRIFDSSGAAIANATISVKNIATGLQRQTATDKDGYYAVPDLPVTGQYVLTVSIAGFATRKVSNLSLRAGVTASVNVTLSPQMEHSQVTALGSTEGVRSDSPQIGNRLDLRKINETPILAQKSRRCLCLIPLCGRRSGRVTCS